MDWYTFLTDRIKNQCIIFNLKNLEWNWSTPLKKLETLCLLIVHMIYISFEMVLSLVSVRSQCINFVIEGKVSFNKRSLHAIGETPNPYEKAISIIGKTLAPFDEDNLIPCFGFGDGRPWSSLSQKKQFTVFLYFAKTITKLICFSFISSAYSYHAWSGSV